MALLLTAENFKQGMLVDDELVGGITEDPEKPGAFVAFVIRSSSGEHLVYRSFDRLEDALDQMNRVRRPWQFEATVGCGESGCGNNEGGSCKINGCGKKRRQIAEERCASACASDRAPASSEIISSTQSK